MIACIIITTTTIFLSKFLKCKLKYLQISYKYIACIMIMMQNVRDYLSKRMEFLVFTLLLVRHKSTRGIVPNMLFILNS